MVVVVVVALVATVVDVVVGRMYICLFGCFIDLFA